MTDFNQVLDKINNLILIFHHLINIIKIPIHIYKNLIKGAYENYVKKSSTRKIKPKKYLN